jgi:hypothetical protein
VFNTDPTDTTTITIAAQFEAGSINQTTRSNSGSFAKTLNIAVDPPRTYSASDFQMKYLDGADQGGNIDFQTKTGVFYTVKYYYLCPANSDSDAVLIKSASVRCTAPANGPDYNVMGINDDQMDHLDNAFCFGGNYPGNVHAQAWFLTLNDGTHSDPFWPASNDCIDVSSDQADGPAFYTLHAPTNADYYDAGDSGYWVATVNFYDQYGNTGLVWVCTQNNVTSFFVMDPN